MPKTSVQRLKVWRGQLERTTGGLTKVMLTKNKRGKIVSKKKSRQAASSNNLGNWLHDSGVEIPKAKILLHKSSPPEGVKQANKPAKVPKKPKSVAAKPKKVAKAPKKVAKPAAKKHPPQKPKPKPKASKPKKAKALKPKVNPITGEPYKKKGGLGFVSGASVDLDNIMLTKPSWDEFPGGNPWD